MVGQKATGPAAGPNRLGVGRIIFVVIRGNRVGVRVGRRWRGGRKRFLLLQHRPELLDGLVQGPQLRQQRQIQLPQTVHFSPQDRQLGVECGWLPDAATLLLTSTDAATSSAATSTVWGRRHAAAADGAAHGRLSPLGHQRCHADALQVDPDRDERIRRMVVERGREGLLLLLLHLVLLGRLQMLLHMLLLVLLLMLLL